MSQKRFCEVKQTPVCVNAIMQTNESVPKFSVWDLTSTLTQGDGLVNKMDGNAIEPLWLDVRYNVDYFWPEDPVEPNDSTTADIRVIILQICGSGPQQLTDPVAGLESVWAPNFSGGLQAAFGFINWDKRATWNVLSDELFPLNYRQNAFHKHFFTKRLEKISYKDQASTGTDPKNGQLLLVAMGGFEPAEGLTLGPRLGFTSVVRFQ